MNCSDGSGKCRIETADGNGCLAAGRGGGLGAAECQQMPADAKLEWRSCTRDE